MNYDKAVTGYYLDKEVIRHLEIADEIRSNPSKLYKGTRHKNAIQADEFDWNVFAQRIVNLQNTKRKKNNPLQKCRLAIGILNADLTYDNKNKARQLLHETVELLEDVERKLRKSWEDETKEIKETEKTLLTSTVLKDDNFWQNISPAKTPKDLDETLETEKERYQDLRREMHI